MRNCVSVFWLLGALLALQTAFAVVSRAADGGGSALQAGENRWVPSFAITSGVTLQKMDGFTNSVLIPGDGDPPSVPLQGMVDGSDLVVSPFVGGDLEVMTPALPIPTRPRLFVSGEILPTFAADRAVAVDGNPGCITGPENGAPCATEDTTVRPISFGEAAANGQGTKTQAQIDTLVFGATAGLSFPARFLEREFRIKPSVGWIRYKVDATGLVVDAECDPDNRCTTDFFGSGFLRETHLEGSGSRTFDGIGPGLDLEMDVYRWGQLGVSLFLGAGAYHVLGGRTITFSTSEEFDDQIGTNDLAVADFEVEVKPWIYRAHLGIRFAWVGSPD